MTEAKLRVSAGAEFVTRDEFQEWCDRYLHKERLDPRTLTASGTATGTDPTILQFPPVPPGLAMAAANVSFFTGGLPGGSGPAATAALCLGRPPISGQPVNPSDVLVPGIANASTVNMQHKVWVARAGQQFYLAVYGSATANQPVSAANSVTNPAANAVIAQTGNVAAGTYNVQVTTGYGTTPGTIYGNFKFIGSGGVSVTHLGPPLVAGASSTYDFQITTASLGALTVEATSADTASGAVYDASIVATPLSTQNPLASGAAVNATLGAILVPDTLEALSWL